MASGRNRHELEARSGGSVDMMAADNVDLGEVSYGAGAKAASVGGMNFITLVTAAAAVLARLAADLRPTTWDVVEPMSAPVVYRLYHDSITAIDGLC